MFLFFLVGLIEKKKSYSKKKWWFSFSETVVLSLSWLGNGICFKRGPPHQRGFVRTNYFIIWTRYGRFLQNSPNIFTNLFNKHLSGSPFSCFNKQTNFVAGKKHVKTYQHHHHHPGPSKWPFDKWLLYQRLRPLDLTKGHLEGPRYITVPRYSIWNSIFQWTIPN